MYVKEILSQNPNAGRKKNAEAQQMEGCVEVLANKGAIVSKMSVQDVENIYDLVAVLEGFATEAAAKNIQPEGLTVTGSFFWRKVIAYISTLVFK